MFDLEYKKKPKQARSKATVLAIIQASAQLMEEVGYVGLTTNDIAKRAGVSIGSLYEYFPGKEAIVAAVATDLVDETLSKMRAHLQSAGKLEFEKAMYQWVHGLYEISREQHKLLKVLLFQVPYIHQVPAVVGMRLELFRIALLGASKTREAMLINLSQESLFLMTTMTGSTLLQLAMMPPPGLEVDKVIDELTHKLIHCFFKYKV